MASENPTDASGSREAHSDRRGDRPGSCDSAAQHADDTAGSPECDLAALRAQIDGLDAEIVRLLSRRGQVAARIGAMKARAGTPVYAPDREREVLDRVRGANPGPFPDRVLLAIYRELMSGSFLLERPLRIAFLGPRGSFSHLAAAGRFGAAVEYEAVNDIAGVFEEVERERVDFGVVPVENSLGGGVIDTLDALAQSRTQVCAEILCRVHHNLLSRVPLERITRVYSKPEVFDQCKRWLLETGLRDKTVAVASTSRAAEQAATEPGAAAIGSRLAAELYDVPIQRERIEDNPHNTTRFLVIGRSMAGPTGADKTAIMFALRDRTGALVDVLSAFRAEGVNLTMITSRPSRQRNWDYYFFVDAAGHVTDPSVGRAIDACRGMCPLMKVLGSFPQAPAETE